MIYFLICVVIKALGKAIKKPIKQEEEEQQQEFLPTFVSRKYTPSLELTKFYAKKHQLNKIQ